MKALLLVAWAFLASAFLFVMPVAAQTCAQFEAVVEGLLKRYQEVPRHLGQGNGFRIVVFVDPAGDTWTVIGVLPDRTACQIVSGTGWETAASFEPEANL